MQINLRKAAAVQDAIQDEIRRINDESHSVQVSLFDPDPKLAMDQQLERVIDTFERTVRLMEAYRFLRAQVARKNAEVGIVDYLAEDSMLGAMEPRVESISRQEVRPVMDHLLQEMQARRDSSDEKINLYGSRKEFALSVPVLDQTTVDQARDELAKIRRRRRKIRDEMVTINVRTEFEVPEQVATVLSELGLD